MHLEDPNNRLHMLLKGNPPDQNQSNTLPSRYLMGIDCRQPKVMSLQEIEVPLDPDIDFLARQMITVRYTTRLDDPKDIARLYEYNPEYIFIVFIGHDETWTPYFSAARHHAELQKALEMEGIAVDSFVKAQAFFSPGRMTLSQMMVFPEDINDTDLLQMLNACFSAISSDFLSRPSIPIYDSGSFPLAEYDPGQKQLFLTLSL